MAVTIRKVGKSLLESLLFLVVLGVGTSFLSMFPALRDKMDIPPVVYLPLLTAGASAVVALAFPKPSFLQAFLKLFIGGIFTFLIFGILVSILGMVVFDAVLDFFWKSGVAIWDWSSADGVIGGIVAVFFYIMMALLVVAGIFTVIFALTHMLVLLVMNLFLRRNEEEAPEAQQPPPFSEQ
jgi:hypothetical protein